MKTIVTNGIYYLELIKGSDGWYWGCDDDSGDLYEAEACVRDGHPLHPNRLIFVDQNGQCFEPVKANEGQYLGQPPIYEDQKIIFLLADFFANRIHIFSFHTVTYQVSVMVELPLSLAKDCYNLRLETPLMLIRQSSDNVFEILWPESISFPIENTETFCFRQGNELYFTVWYEDEDYREEVVVRDLQGNVIKRMDGTIHILSNGKKWHFI